MRARATKHTQSYSIAYIERTLRTYGHLCHDSVASAIHAEERWGLATVEVVAGACLQSATRQAPRHAKAQLRWGHWCYRQGCAQLKAISRGEIAVELTPDELRAVEALQACQ